MQQVSIIIPAYNRGAFLSRTLDSVMSQTFSDWSCIIVDDHSTDNSKEIILEYCKKDSRFHYMLNSRKKGAQGARNTGLFASNAEWAFFFDSDNVMHPGLLETLLSEAGDSQVCKCFSNIVDARSGSILGLQDWIAEGDISNALFNGNTYVDYNQEIIRRECLLEIGGLDEDCPSLQEFDTNIRLSKVAGYHTVKVPLVDYYVGGNDTISSNYEKQVKGKLYNLGKFKKQWLADKQNAARFIYETYEKLKKVESKRFKYALKLVFTVPEMIPFYVRKHLL